MLRDLSQNREGPQACPAEPAPQGEGRAEGRGIRTRRDTGPKGRSVRCASHSSQDASKELQGPGHLAWLWEAPASPGAAHQASGARRIQWKPFFPLCGQHKQSFSVWRRQRGSQKIPLPNASLTAQLSRADQPLSGPLVTYL